MFLSNRFLIFTAAKVFKIDRDIDFKVNLKDNNNINLSKSNFNKVIDQFSKCACFHVKFLLEARAGPELLITPDVSAFVRHSHFILL